VTRHQELDIESPRRLPERPLSFTSAANARLGARFVTHKLSQRLERAYPLKQSGRMSLHAYSRFSEHFFTPFFVGAI
jgi:hypothetical protein